MNPRQSTPVLMLLSDGNATPHGFLETYDPEAHDGRGAATATWDLTKAIRFPDATAALVEYGREPGNRPLREDGRPNRPLTAFTITLLSPTDAALLVGSLKRVAGESTEPRH